MLITGESIASPGNISCLPTTRIVFAISKDSYFLTLELLAKNSCADFCAACARSCAAFNEIAAGEAWEPNKRLASPSLLSGASSWNVTRTSTNPSWLAAIVESILFFAFTVICEELSNATDLAPSIITPADTRKIVSNRADIFRTGLGSRFTTTRLSLVRTN